VKTFLDWVGGDDWLSNLNSHRLCDSWWDPVRLAPSEGPGIRTAAIHFGGWYDVFTQGTLNGYKLWRTSSDPDIANRQYLIMAPADHYHPGGNVAGPRTFPESASIDFMATTISYLQWCFDGYNDVVDSWPRVQYYLMGADEPGAPGNEWRGAPDWPIPAEEIRLFLSGDGTLSATAPVVEGQAAVPMDPANPSPTVGGRNLLGSLGAEDQADVESRPDAVIFTSEPLAKPLEVVGHLYASLRVLAQGADADVAVRVTDVHPDGRSILITDGIQRLSMRNGCAEAAEVTPGTPMDVDVDLWSTAYVFAPGHRVRMIVTASNYPRFELNPALHDQPAGTAFTLALSTTGASALRLPVPRPVDPAPEVVEFAEPSDPVDVIEAASDVAEDAAPELPDPDALGDLPSPDAPLADMVAPADLPPDAVATEDVPVPADVPARDDGADAIGSELAVDAAAIDLSTGDAAPQATSGGGCAAGDPPRTPAASLLALGALFALATGLRRRRF